MPTPATANRYRAILHGMEQAFCLVEVLHDPAGRATDYRYLEANAAFEQLTGLGNPAGHTLSELLPGAEAYWATLYDEVARTRQPRRIEHLGHLLGNRWYEVYALPGGPPGSWQVAVLFTDITARKQTEQHHDFLLRLSDTLRPLADSTAIQEVTAQTTRTFFGADRCCYGEIEGEQCRIRRDDSRAGLPPVAGTYSLASLPIFRAILAAGQPLVVEDVRHTDLVDEPMRQLCLQLEVCSFIAVPACKDGQLRGVLCVVQSVPRPWRPAEVQLTTEVAERTWAAVERSRTEHTLRASEAKYRTLFESIDEGFSLIELLTDAQGTATDYRFLEVNRVFERQTGLTNVVGRLMSEVAPGTERHWLDAYGQVARTGQSVRLENYHASTGRWYEAYATRLGEAGGQLCVVFDDVTERKRRENAQALLAEVSRELVGVADLDRTLQRLGASIGRHFGVQRCLFSEWGAHYETHQRTLWDASGRPAPPTTYQLRNYLTDELLEASQQGAMMVVPDTQTDPRVHAANYRAAGVGAFVTVPLAREEHWQFLLSIVASGPRPWRPDEVELLGELATRIWRRLEQARAEQALRQSTEQLRLALDAAELGTWDWHLATDEVRCNSRLCQQLALEPGPAPLTSADVRRLIHPADQDRVWQHLQAAIAGPELFAAEFRVIISPGQECWISGYGQATDRAPDGRARRLGGVLLDISARKQAEEAAALRQRLQQQQTLFEAVQAAQEEERHRMAESLHNGLGQLLYAVKIQLDLLPPLPEQPARREAARLLGDAIRQTRALSHELTPPTLETLGLQQTLETICRQLAGGGLRWHCHIVVDEAPPLPQTLQLAVYRLAQGLTHNVARHASATEATLEVEVLPGWVVLRVEDNGRGFDPVTVTEGLGLRTLRSRVGLLAGTLHIDSAPDQGTHIWARLPIG